jgi:1,4-dihydroxy-2-naphthoate octaprenyltransferase
MSAASQEGRATPGAWRAWVGAMRLRTLPAAVAPVVVGTSLAWRDGRFDAPAALLCLAFALLIQVGTNFSNDYHDFMKGADTAGRVGPRRAVAAGLISPGAMRGASLLVMAAAFAVGLGLVGRGGPWLIAVGAVSIVCGFAYTGGPYPLGYHGFGDVCVFIFFGLVAVCATYFVQAGRVSGDAILAAVPVGLLATNILLVNNYRDMETDAAAGKRTLVVRLGRGFARGQHALSLLVAMGVPYLFYIRGGSGWTLLPVGLAPLAWSQVKQLRAARAPADQIALLGRTAGFLALFAALFAAGVVL